MSAKSDSSRVNVCIRMLEILYSRPIVSVADLAQELGTNPRNIPEYKKELINAGYIIESVPGRYGGYQLNKTSLFPAAKLTTEEQNSLLNAYSFLLVQRDYLDRQNLSSAMGKLAASLERGQSQGSPLVVDKFPLSMTNPELEKRYESIARCIELKTAMQFTYLPKTNIPTDYTFDPYKLFVYHGSWYVLGKDEATLQILTLKVNRILAYKLTEKGFRISSVFSESDYLDEYGMKQFGEWYQIKLRVTGPFAMLVRERIYGKNQTIECIDTGTTILTCEMQNQDVIESFALGFGSNCTVIEPQWLRDRLLRVSDYYKSTYEGDRSPL